MTDIAFERFCEENAALGEMLAEDRRDVERRLAVCRHQRSNEVRGELVCRDCGKVVGRKEETEITEVDEVDELSSSLRGVG